MKPLFLLTFVLTLSIGNLVARAESGQVLLKGGMVMGSAGATGEVSYFIPDVMAFFLGHPAFADRQDEVRRLRPELTQDRRIPPRPEVGLFHPFITISWEDLPADKTHQYPFRRFVAETDTGIMYGDAVDFVGYIQMTMDTAPHGGYSNVGSKFFPDENVAPVSIKLSEMRFMTLPISSGMRENWFNGLMK